MIKAAVTTLFTAALVATAAAQTNTYVFSFAVDGAVPDGNPSGMINRIQPASPSMPRALDWADCEG